jgi:ribosome-associated protein
MDRDRLEIDEYLSIPLSEVSFRFSRSSGPGGQHAQKSSTRAELTWDVAQSPSLTEAQRARLMQRLRGYIDSRGVLHLVSQSERSQRRNREEVIARLQTLVRQALKRRKKRKPTRPTAGSRERRLRAKRKRSEIKRLRGRVRDE